ncbi:MAG: ATP-binding cassette domain-containing protein [Acidimicrobiales bacterium]|nr:ATP-binding cassette domain-containing protein [Acidimicrobiales bacterium]
MDAVSVRLGGRQVLDDVTFKVPPGRVVGLLGPNGAGKTTSMRVMLGVIAPDEGHVSWNGQEATPAGRDRWGYMTQERGLYVKMRARDQLIYMGRLKGLSKADAATRTDELLAALNLSDRADDKIERLSGGMQQRIQLAASLVHDPDVLVLDEPFSGLDPTAVDELTEVIRKQASGGRTVVFSSHQLDLVEDICESIILINEGTVVLDGELRTLKQQSDDRILRLSLDAVDPGWTQRLDGAAVVSHDASETLLKLDPGTDPLRVLDQARAAGTVHDFGLELPRLSQLFREAVTA